MFAVSVLESDANGLDHSVEPAIMAGLQGAGGWGGPWHELWKRRREAAAGVIGTSCSLAELPQSQTRGLGLPPPPFMGSQCGCGVLGILNPAKAGLL